MYPRDVIACMVTDPKVSCLIVLKPGDGLRIWIPPERKQAIRSGEVSLVEVQVMVATHYLANHEAYVADLVRLSARVAPNFGVGGEIVSTPEQASVSRRPAFARMMRHVQFHTRTDAAMAFNRGSIRTYLPDPDILKLHRGEAERHIVLMTAVAEIIRGMVDHYAMWRHALDIEMPGLADAFGLDALVERLRRDAHSTVDPVPPAR